MKDFWSKYRKYIRSNTYTTAVMNGKIKAWLLAWGGKIDVERGNKVLATSETHAAVARQLLKTRFIEDTDSVPRKLRIKPNQRHDLAAYSPRRGGKVEVVHGQQKHFANLQCGPRLAHALHMHGNMRYNEDRTAARIYHDSQSDTLTPVHYSPQQKFHLNELAKSAEMTLPYPTYGILPADNGERFLNDYHVAQRKRNVVHAVAYRSFEKGPR